jgi:hypothetical protein
LNFLPSWSDGTVNANKSLHYDICASTTAVASRQFDAYGRLTNCLRSKIDLDGDFYNIAPWFCDASLLSILFIGVILSGGRESQVLAISEHITSVSSQYH